MLVTDAERLVRSRRSLAVMLVVVLGSVGAYAWAFKPFDVLVMLAWAALTLVT